MEKNSGCNKKLEPGSKWPLGYSVSILFGGGATSFVLLLFFGFFRPKIKAETKPTTPLVPIRDPVICEPFIAV